LGKRGNRPTVEKSTSRGSSSMSSRQSGPRGSSGAAGSSGSAALNLRQRKRYCYFCKEDVNYID
jgi:hypothetical protein